MAHLGQEIFYKCEVHTSVGAVPYKGDHDGESHTRRSILGEEGGVGEGLWSIGRYDPHLIRIVELDVRRGVASL